MSELRQRETVYRDRKHLAFVRAQGCCLPFCRRPAEAAHIRFSIDAIGKTSPGMQRKPCDSFTVPLCAYHHRTGIDSQHNSNEREWWKMRGIDPFAIAASFWIASGGAERELQPKPAQQSKKIKARKPAEQRAKIQQRKTDWPKRSMQSSSRLSRRTSCAAGAAHATASGFGTERV